jgi:hypothetical protein
VRKMRQPKTEAMIIVDFGVAGLHSGESGWSQLFEARVTKRVWRVDVVKNERGAILVVMSFFWRFEVVKFGILPPK